MFQKEDVKNSYKIHLHLASLPDDEWNALLKVFDAFKKVTITDPNIFV